MTSIGTVDQKGTTAPEAPSEKSTKLSRRQRLTVHDLRRERLEARIKEADVYLNSVRGMRLEERDKRLYDAAEDALNRMLDQYFDNVYFKLEIIGSQMRRVLWILGALTVLLLTLSPLIGAFQWMAVTMLFGAVGAALSRALTAGFGDSRIPQVLGNPAIPLLRLSVGALSAIVVLCVVRSEILPIEPPAGYGSYVWAVAAGFSDQLLNRMMIAVANSAEK